MNSEDVSNGNYEILFTYGSMHHGVKNKYYVVVNSGMLELWNKNVDSENFVLLTSMIGEQKDVQTLLPKFKGFAMSHHDDMLRQVDNANRKDGIYFG